MEKLVVRDNLRFKRSKNVICQNPRKRTIRKNKKDKRSHIEIKKKIESRMIIRK